MEILEFKDLKNSPDIVHTYTSSLRNNKVPIIIDNGSYQCRVGWATSPQPLLLFKNLIAKPRKERSKKDTVETFQAPQLQVGNDIINIEAVRFQLKTQFDRNVVTHFEAQEHLFDYAFTHLGIDSENGVPHPIVLTEAIFNPNTSRQLMSELLFECYSVPGITYSIDSLLAYHFNEVKPPPNALIISLGYHTCHVIPVIDKKTSFTNIRRLNTGGFHVISFLHRILQLKYPAHATSITLSRAEELLHSICELALDYRGELKKWTDPVYYEENIKRIQLPYNATVNSVQNLEQQKERKRELARRLTEINARKREERLAEDEEKLGQLLYIQELVDAEVDKEEIDKVCGDFQIRNIQDLQKNISALNGKIEKTKQKIQAASCANDEIEEPVAKQAKKMVFETEKELHLYLQNAKKVKQEILSKKMLRKQRKQDMAKRRTAAGQERMRIISQLARKEKGNDDFGLRDEDWDIYKAISKDGGDSDSEMENEKLLELDDIIRTHEPTDVEDSTSNPGETHQLHVGIERYRAPELLFKPYMAGSPEAGLSEVIEYVLSLFDEEQRLLLAENVIIIGGLANLRGLKERITSELVASRPYGSRVVVGIGRSPSQGAWLGARKVGSEGMVTKEMYDEYGGEYLVEHLTSNKFWATPKGVGIDVPDV